ncbi:hypothetical protein [Algicella marina]|uniref:Lipoprotein n=1 Tax=Algicella marina TaxID=2683284 RepID=A0A6P1SVR9_9RHOB|nr:hypothetical protein [Algicella marina]QHQ34774.1 hypothetical protein GO499_05975 [Algicella marina]
MKIRIVPATALAVLLSLAACADPKAEGPIAYETPHGVEVTRAQQITLGNGQRGWEISCMQTTEGCQYRAADICSPRGYSIYATGLQARTLLSLQRGVRLQISCL